MADGELGGTDGGEVVISKRTGKPVRRQASWTRERREAFLQELARTCNAGKAAASLGMSPAGLYKLRRRDENFREQFARAVQAGYEQVEAELLSHALGHGGSGDDGERAEALPGFDAELAIKLLAQRNARDRGRPVAMGAAVKRASEREIEDELVSKLKGLAKRLALIP